MLQGGNPVADSVERPSFRERQGHTAAEERDTQRWSGQIEH